jgi:hypothetical protein
MRIVDSGNVGIGTTAPACILHLENNSGEQLRFNRTSDSSSFASWYSNGTVYGYVGGASVLTTGGSATDFTVRAQNNLLFAIGTQERARIDSSGRLLVGTSSDSGGALLQVNGNRVRIATAKTPASASDTGTAGEICWDANYIYVCTATNTWKRTAISTW